MSDDTISRQAAIDAVCMEWCNVKHQDCKHQFDDEKDDYYWCDGCETVLRTLPDLPSVLPKRGRWLPVKRCDGGYWVCSSCKNPTEAFAANVLYKYCPFCGADMRKQKLQYGDEDTSQGGLMSAT